MEEQILSILEGLIESRNTFFARTLEIFSSPDVAYNRFLASELSFINLANRIYTNRVAPPPSLVINIPSNFMDNLSEPVVVVPSGAQIAQNVETIDIGIPATQMQCAICQDTILNTGSRIRQCGHTYHPECLTSWLSMSVRCPVCRHDIREVAPARAPVAGLPTGTSSDAV
jgi:hypothetical protein